MESPGEASSGSAEAHEIVIPEFEELRSAESREASSGSEEFDLEEIFQRAWEISDDITIEGRFNLETEPPVLSYRREASIFRVPPEIRGKDPKSFEPEVIAIGPFHRDKEALKQNESIKLNYLRDFLRECSSSMKNVTVHDLVLAVLPSEQRARRCYSEDVGLDENAFVRMLVTDGCFIIQFLWKVLDVDWELSELEHLVLKDLTRLENQIPFFILRILFEKGLSHIEISLDELFCHFAFYIRIIDRFNIRSRKIGTSEPAHMIDWCRMILLANPPSIEPRPESGVFRRCAGSTWRWISNFLFYVLWFLLMCKKPPSNIDEEMGVGSIPPATTFHDGGVRFVKNYRKGLSTISFNSGKMEMPVFIIEESSATLYQNIIAFEYLHSQKESYVGFYAKFMSRLIETEADVDLLSEEGILILDPNCKKEAVTFFKSIGSAVQGFRTEETKQLFREVRKHARSHRFLMRADLVRRWRAAFGNAYISSKWAVISLAAAAVLLVLTLMQTIFSILAYYNKG